MLTLIVIIYYVWLKLAKIGDIIQMFIDEFLIDSLNKMIQTPVRLMQERNPVLVIRGEDRVNNCYLEDNQWKKR